MYTYVVIVGHRKHYIGIRNILCSPDDVARAASRDLPMLLFDYPSSSSFFLPNSSNSSSSSSSRSIKPDQPARTGSCLHFAILRSATREYVADRTVEKEKKKKKETENNKCVTLGQTLTRLLFLSLSLFLSCSSR